MKNIFSLFVIFALTFQSCSSQTYLDSGTLQQIVSQKEFTFMAQRANPVGMDAINTINTLPGAASTRILELSYGYDIVFKNNEMEVTLPYFGRVFNSRMGNNSEGGYRFTSKDFSISTSVNKKGTIIWLIKPNDKKEINSMNLEILKTGKAYLSISSNDRQPISYDGYIMKNETPKK